jgi:hypothetical protein
VPTAMRKVFAHAFDLPAPPRSRPAG